VSTLCFIQQHDFHVTDKCPYVVGPLALGVGAKLPELAARWRLYGAAVHTFFASSCVSCGFGSTTVWPIVAQGIP